MKSNKRYGVLLLFLLIIYVVAEINKPQQMSWESSLNRSDKNPFGTYVLFQQLKNCYPNATIGSYREPVYNRLHNNTFQKTAYFLIAPTIKLSELDRKELLAFVQKGNCVYVSAFDIDTALLDSLGLVTKDDFSINLKNATSIHLVNKSLRLDSCYTADKASLSQYFDSVKNSDSSIVLGANNRQQPNFVQVNVGSGAFFVHTCPLVYSNYFLLHNNNVAYISAALSYILADVQQILWDEYYQLGSDGAQTPLRFFLNDTYLRWALWLSIVGALLFVLFEMKRRQRIIPVIAPLQNTSAEFVQTVATVYFHQKDNASIAQKKWQHWLGFVRNHFCISTQYLNAEFVALLAKKSGVDAALVQQIVDYGYWMQGKTISDKLLIEINAAIDQFYAQAK